MRARALAVSLAARPPLYRCVHWTEIAEEFWHAAINWTLAAPSHCSVGDGARALPRRGMAEWKADVVFTLAGSFVEEETALAPAADGVMASGLLSLSRSDTFENGLTLSWHGAVRYDRDAPSRPAFCRRAGQLPGEPIRSARVSRAGRVFSPVSPRRDLRRAAGR